MDAASAAAPLSSKNNLATLPASVDGARITRINRVYVGSDTQQEAPVLDHDSGIRSRDTGIRFASFLGMRPFALAILPAFFLVLACGGTTTVTSDAGVDADQDGAAHTTSCGGADCSDYCWHPSDCPGFPTDASVDCGHVPPYCAPLPAGCDPSDPRSSHYCQGVCRGGGGFSLPTIDVSKRQISCFSS